MRSSPTANPPPLGPGALVAALVIGLTRSRIRRRVDPVPEELLGYANDAGRTEADYAQQFNGRLVNLVGAAGIVLALVISLGGDVFARLRPDDPDKPALELGSVGEPAFIALYLLAIVLLVAAASVAVMGVYVGRGSRAARVSAEGYRHYGSGLLPMAVVRRRLYGSACNYLEDQRKLNLKRRTRVQLAGALFLAAIFVVTADAALLGVRVLGL
jgi:hypothetical protein